MQKTFAADALRIQKLNVDLDSSSRVLCFGI